MAGTIALTAPSWHWIISRRADLSFLIIGGALSSFLFFSLHAYLGVDLVLAWFLWFMLLDSPHFFGTYLRTYLDKEEFKRRRKLLLGSLLFFAVGPGILLLCYGFFSLQLEWYAVPFLFLRTFVSLWAYWHVVRQHYGIMALYKWKNGDREPQSLKWDSWTLHVGLLLPFVVLLTRHSDSTGMLGASAQRWLQSSSEAVGQLGLILLGALLVAFYLRERQRYVDTGAVNFPKILLVSILIPLHTFFCYHPAILTTGLHSFGAFVTIFHDFQYLAIAWFYQRSKCHAPGEDASQFGMAGYLTRHLSFYVGAAVLSGVLVAVVSCRLDVFPGCRPWFSFGSLPLFGTFSYADIFRSLLLGAIMIHYFVDQFIWRPSKDRDVRSHLALA